MHMWRYLLLLCVVFFAVTKAVQSKSECVWVSSVSPETKAEGIVTLRAHSTVQLKCYQSSKSHCIAKIYNVTEKGIIEWHGPKGVIENTSSNRILSNNDLEIEVGAGGTYKYHCVVRNGKEHGVMKSKDFIVEVKEDAHIPTVSNTKGTLDSSRSSGSQQFQQVSTSYAFATTSESDLRFLPGSATLTSESTNWQLWVLISIVSIALVVVVGLVVVGLVIVKRSYTTEQTSAGINSTQITQLQKQLGGYHDEVVDALTDRTTEESVM